MRSDIPLTNHRFEPEVKEHKIEIIESLEQAGKVGILRSSSANNLHTLSPKQIARTNSHPNLSTSIHEERQSRNLFENIKLLCLHNRININISY